MDFEFRKDIYGQPTARFSMEHQLIGRWLSEEMSSNRYRVVEILNIIQQIESGRLGFKELTHVAYLLTISSVSVEIQLTSSESNGDYGDSSDFEGDDYAELTSIDGESFAECGLEDFKQLLMAWLNYIE